MLNTIGLTAVLLLILFWAVCFELNYREHCEKKDPEWGRECHARFKKH